MLKHTRTSKNHKHFESSDIFNSSSGQDAEWFVNNYHRRPEILNKSIYFGGWPYTYLILQMAGFENNMQTF
jgi:hypothetical protein